MTIETKFQALDNTSDDCFRSNGAPVTASAERQRIAGRLGRTALRGRELVRIGDVRIVHGDTDRLVEVPTGSTDEASRRTVIAMVAEHDVDPVVFREEYLSVCRELGLTPDLRALDNLTPAWPAPPATGLERFRDPKVLSTFVVLLVGLAIFYVLGNRHQR
ncbi:MAG: hypothetical protein Q8S73_40115 [Deltaproteobacteria bacterium]|nr:hypothetical protein [Deltaproteobacteria bacterium]